MPTSSMIYQQRFRGYSGILQVRRGPRATWPNSNTSWNKPWSKTLARQVQNVNVAKIYRKYKGTRTVDGHTYNTLQVEIPTTTRSTVYLLGSDPAQRRQARLRTTSDDQGTMREYQASASDLVQRLQADKCELCGLRRRLRSPPHPQTVRSEATAGGVARKARWVKRMIAMQRKTLVVCHRCHAASMPEDHFPKCAR